MPDSGGVMKVSDAKEVVRKKSVQKEKKENEYVPCRLPSEISTPIHAI